MLKNFKKLGRLANVKHSFYTNLEHTYTVLFSNSEHRLRPLECEPDEENCPG